MESQDLSAIDPMKEALKAEGINKLNPMQKKVLEKGLLKDRNMIVSAPTASGKTLLAEIAALETIKKGLKVVYIVPLKALASEKYEDMKAKYSPLGIKVALSIGDRDSSDPWLSKFDLIVLTSEKLDSLLRHGIQWIQFIGLVIADEIHLLDSPERGPTLEVVITRLRQVSNPRILGFSATISNYKDLAGWLDAVPVHSEYRPVKLYRGVCYEGTIAFHPQHTEIIDQKEPPLFELVEQTLRKKKQALVFINTRRSTESTAEKLGRVVKRSLSEKETRDLKELSESILKVLGSPTKQCYRLAECVKNGTTFHNAGLVAKQRKLIEDAFRKGLIKVICATTTWAAGINTPAYRVIVRDLKRFSSYRGMDFIPVLECQQMQGRAGRPGFDSVGQAILLPKNELEARYAWDHYINGKPEDISSKLGVEPVLRTHVLALIASGVTPNKQTLMDFFFKTFYAYQYKDFSRLEMIFDKILKLLEEFNLIEITGESSSKKDNPFQSASEIEKEGNQELRPTNLGKRISELYLDPLTADLIIKSLSHKKVSITPLNLLHLISSTLEMRPRMSLRIKEYEPLRTIIEKEASTMLIKPPEEWDPEFEDYLRTVKLAVMLNSWMNESGEDLLLEHFGTTPGELRARLESADWLLYSTQEIALLLGCMSELKDIKKVRLRLKYGVKEELLPLVKLKNVGRIRARRLFKANLRSLNDLRKTPLVKIENIIGKETARSIKEQLGELKEIEEEKDVQSSL